MNNLKIHRWIIGTAWISLGAIIASPLIMGITQADAKTLILGGLMSLLLMGAGFVLIANLSRLFWLCLPCTALSFFLWKPIGAIFSLYYLWLYFAKEKRRPT